MESKGRLIDIPFTPKGVPPPPPPVGAEYRIPTVLMSDKVLLVLFVAKSVTQSKPQMLQFVFEGSRNVYDLMDYIVNFCENVYVKGVEREKFTEYYKDAELCLSGNIVVYRLTVSRQKDEYRFKKCGS